MLSSVCIIYTVTVAFLFDKCMLHFIIQMCMIDRFNSHSDMKLYHVTFEEF